MKLKETIHLAFEALVANKLRAGLTMLGMVIGVGAVVLLVSIGNGASRYITREFEGLGTNVIFVQPGKTDEKSGFGPPPGRSRNRITLSDIRALERLSLNLQAVTGVMFGNVQVKHADRVSNVSSIGSNEKLLEIFSFKMSIGSFVTREDDDTGRRVVTLGYGIAQNLFPDQNPLGQLVKINDSEFRVIGTLQKTGQSLGFNIDDVAFIPTKAAMRLFNDDRLFGIRARAKSRVSIEDATEELKTILMEQHGGEDDFTVFTQASMIQTMDSILGMLTYVLGGIAMISMIVGGIGILNIMFVSVTERTREIGIRRAVGARRSDILKQFMAEAVVLSLIGGLTGLIGSSFLTYIMYWAVPHFDMRPPLWILPPAFFMSLITGVVFGVWPARKAAKINTIDALRYE